MWIASFDCAAFMIEAASDGDAMRAPAAMAAALIEEPSEATRESVLSAGVFVSECVAGTWAED
jgi:hypothetical protein